MGKTKTRLIPAMGIHNATRLYEAFLSDTLLHAQQTGFDVELWVAGDPSHASLSEFDLPRFAQQGAGLGERMRHALGTHTHSGRPAILIGSDAPTLSPGLMQHAAGLLAGSDVVLSPASDGGFVLIGAKVPLPSLSTVAWSTASTLEQTQAALSSLSVSLSPPHYDVDEPDDLDLLEVHILVDPTSAPHTLAHHQTTYPLAGF